MNILKRSFITPSLVLLLATNLYAGESYTIKTTSLKEAIKKISKISKLPFIVDTDILKGKKANSIENVQSLEHALKQIFKGTGLEATINNDTIVIRKIKNYSSNHKQLKDITVFDNQEAKFALESDFISNITAEDIKKFGGSRSVVNVDLAKEYGDTSISDAMKRVPGVISTKQNGTGGSPSSLNIGVRGMAQRLSPRSTILVDGIPLAVAPYGQPQLSLAPLSFNMISDIDVIRGGGSVRYGPQNVGGVINFITKDIPRNLKTEFEIGSVYYTEGNSGLENKSISFSTGSMLSDNFGVILFYDGVKGSSWREHSKTDIDNVVLKTKYLINDSNLLTTRFSYYQAENELPGGLTTEEYEDNPYQSRRSFDNFKGKRKEISLDYKNIIASDLLLNMKSYYNTSDREFTYSRGAVDISNRFDTLPRDYKVFGLESRITKKLEVNSYPTELSFGHRYIYEDANEKRYRKTSLTGTEVNNRNSHNNTYANSYYTDWRWVIDELTVTPGIRLEDVKVTRENKLSDYSEDVTYHEYLPSINANYQINENWNAFVNYNKSFGSVQHLQLNLKETSSRTTLNPEIADVYEVGTRYDGENSSFDLTLYNIDFKNKLGYSIDSGAWENNGHTKSKGLEFSGRYFLDNFDEIFKGNSIYANYTYTDAKYKDQYSGNKVEFTSEHTGLIGYEFARDNWNTYIELYAQSEQYSDAANTIEENISGDKGLISGYGLVNVGYNKKMKLFKNDASFSIGIKNLFDKDTYSRSTDTLGNGKYIGEPRNINFSIKISI